MTNPLVKIVSSAHTAIGKYHFSLRRTKASWRNGRFQSPDKAWTTSVWRTLSHERARRPSLTTRPESNTWPYHLDPYSSLTRKEDSESPVSQPKSSKRKSQCFFPGGWLLGLPGSCVLTQGGKDMARLLLPPRALHHEHCSIPGHLGWLGHLLFSVWQPEMIKKCVFIRHCCKFDTYFYINVP